MGQFEICGMWKNVKNIKVGNLGSRPNNRQKNTLKYYKAGSK
jgi:hypothetical protein